MFNGTVGGGWESWKPDILTADYSSSLHEQMTLISQLKPHVFRCERANMCLRWPMQTLAYASAWDFDVEALSSASYTSIITFSVRSIPEHLAALKSAKTSGLIYFHGGK